MEQGYITPRRKRDSCQAASDGQLGPGGARVTPPRYSEITGIMELGEATWRKRVILAA